MERRRKSASSFFSLLLLFPPPSSLSLNIFPFYSFSRQKPDKRNLSHLLLPPFKSTQSSSSVRGSKRNRRTLSTTDVSLPLSLPSSSFTSSSSLRQTLFSSSPPPSLFSSPFLSSSSSLLLSPRRNSLSSHNPARYTPSRLSPCRSLWHSLLSSSSSSLQSITSSLLPSFSPSSSSSPSDLDLPPYPSSSSSSSSRQERSSSSPSSSALTHHERRVIAACASEYFQVVRDVQFYQDFIPWCQESRILTETVVVEEKNAEEKKEKTKEGEEEEDFHERKKDEKRRIIEMFEAELVIGFSFITDRYTSKVYLKRPPNSSSSSSSLLLPSSSIPSIPSSSSFSSFSSSPSVGWDYEVSVVAADSTVFNTLVNEWRFRRIDSRSPPPKGGEVPGSPSSSSSSCLVDFFIEFELKNSIHQNLARIFLKDVASTMSRGFDARVASLRGSSSSLSSSFLSPSDVSFFERRQKREDTEREEKNMIKRMKMKKEDLSDLEVSKTKDTGEVYLEGEKGKEKHMTCLTPLSSSSPCNERERKKKELGENIGDRQQRDSSSSSPLFSSSPFSLPSYSSSLSLSSPVSSEVPSSASHEETFPSAVSLKSTGEKSLLTLSPPREEDKEEEEQTSEKDRVVSSLSSHSPRSENLVRRRKRRESIDRSSKVCREHLHKLKDEESPAIQGLQESKPLEEDEEEKDKKKRKMRKRASSFLSSSLSPLPEIASVMALSEEAVERNSLSPLELAHLLRLIDSLSLLDLPLPKHRHVLNSQQLAGQRSWLATPHDHPELAMRRQSRSSSIPVNRHRHSGLPFTRGDRIGRRRRQKTTSSCIVFSSSPSHRYSCDGEEHAEDLPLVLLSYEERCDLQSLLLLGDGEIRKAILACFLAYSSSSSLSSSPLSSFRSFHPHQQHDWRSFFLTLPSFLSKKERRKEMTNDMSSDLPACEGKTGSKEQAKEKKKEEETNPFPRDNEEKKASKTRERNFFRSFFSSFNVRKRESENSRRGDSEIGPSQRNGNLEKEDEDEEQKKKKEERTIFGKPYEAAGLHGERRGEQEEVVEEEEEERGSRRRRKEKIRERIERRKDEDRGSTLRLPQSQSGEKRRKEEIEEEERMSEGVDKKLFLSIQKRYVPLLLQGLRGILEEGKRRKRGRIKTR